MKQIKMKREKNKLSAIKSGNPKLSCIKKYVRFVRKGEGNYGGGIYRKGKFWVWNGTERSDCDASESGDADDDSDELLSGERKMRWQGLIIIDRLAKFFRKFISETRWGKAERAVVTFQRGIERWTSKGDNIRGTSAAMWLKSSLVLGGECLSASAALLSPHTLYTCV